MLLFLHVLISFIYLFFFWCRGSHKVNDPKAELGSEGAKDEILTPPALPTLLWHISSPWGCWATAGPGPGTFCRCLGGLVVKAFLCPLGAASKYSRSQRHKESNSVPLCWEHLGKVLEQFMEILCPLQMPRWELPQVLGPVVPAEKCKVALMRQNDPLLRGPD